jgi:hypothetical protein
VAVKFVVSDSLDNNHVGLRESVLSQLLSHPNVIQTYTSRCSVMDDVSLQAIHANTGFAGRASEFNVKKGFVSGDGFGDPRQQLVNAPVTFSKILLQLQVKPGQFVAVVIMEYADKVRCLLWRHSARTSSAPLWFAGDSAGCHLQAPDLQRKPPLEQADSSSGSVSHST